MPPSQQSYQTHTGEPGILVEIYFPKRMDYQGGLYNALREGLNINNVKRYISNNKQGVLPLLFESMKKDELREGRIAEIQPVFEGFSMYEVDGVFVGRGGQPIEERTQVIRLLIRPKYEELLKGVPEAYQKRVREHVRRFQKLPLSLLSDEPIDSYMIETFPNKAETDNELFKYVRDALKKKVIWLEDAYYFIFGYVVCNLTQIENLKEEEIWVTSYRSAVINVIRPNKA